MLRKKRSFFHEHSLTLVAAGVLASWIVAYSRSDPSSRVGAFFGNAVADWSGVVVAVFGTKYFFERGSAESKPVPRKRRGRLVGLLVAHSFTIALLLTGGAWLFLYLRMAPDSKWGQVVGNVLSEWVQLTGLVLLTKTFFERGSKESGKR